MMMNALYAVLALAAAALATPLAMTPRDSVSPPITNPTAQTVWRVGDTVTVEWDVAALNGAQPSNPLAKIILGTLADNVEHLMIESPLVSNFPILGGNVSLVVPSVPSGSDYIVCLFGTSGDISPAFTIVGTDASSTLGQTLAASSSNTLPPHQTTDPSTTDRPGVERDVFCVGHDLGIRERNVWHPTFRGVRHVGERHCSWNLCERDLDFGFFDQFQRSNGWCW
ncbi:hypothetical protein L227DRAFT_562040 [Lentinus tigrinus ALCF2SS1-6]|uniref:Uncharacterized protein n=1 Tax=Lentinus tigrinus ALCF2SS1-6 TaxID=1328759 RepID=A0A5C2SHL2_9APHY|nr:hypothetical protein L227DRAFT_562040 [Lentinus tigrinus ALCF2SS1-6]